MGGERGGLNGRNNKNHYFINYFDHFDEMRKSMIVTAIE